MEAPVHTERNWSAALRALVVSLVLGAACVWGDSSLEGSAHWLLSCLGSMLGVLGFGIIAVGVRGFLAEANPRLVARWSVRLAGRGWTLVRLLFLALLMATGTVFFAGGALNPHFLGASGTTSTGDVAMLVALAAVFAVFGGYVVWQMVRVIRGLPVAFTSGSRVTDSGPSAPQD